MSTQNVTPADVANMLEQASGHSVSLAQDLVSRARALAEFASQISTLPSLPLASQPAVRSLVKSLTDEANIIEKGLKPKLIHIAKAA